MNPSPFHAGERAVHARLGLGDSIEQFASQVIRPYMPRQHREFFEQLPFLVAAARDSKQRPWVTLLAGVPGFIQADDDRILTIGAQLARGNPLAGAIFDDVDVGLLGIELDTRRRNRVNGKLFTAADGSLRFETKQSFGNCPQYITQRQWIKAPTEQPTPSTNHGFKLTQSQERWVTGADTFFIGTGYTGAEISAANGMDASHRGGPPGFVELEDSSTLVFPDYAGNNHFNTIGNLVQDPRVALLFVDFEGGHLLHITGTAEIDWQSDSVSQRPGAQRLVRIQIHAVVEQRHILPIRWQTPAKDALSLRVVDRVNESDTICSFVLQSADGKILPEFLPGQHLPIALPVASELARRTYSLSSAPGGQTYRISVKREPNGLVSQHLHNNLSVGSPLTAGIPAGNFALQDNTQPVSLISAGIGITPMLSMLEHLVHTQSGRRILFVHGARDGQQQAFAREVLDLTAGHDTITTQLLLSQPKVTDRLGGNYHRQGRVSAAAIAALHPDLDGEFYLCGPTAMIAEITAGLLALGVAEQRIHHETFGPKRM